MTAHVNLQSSEDPATVRRLTVSFPGGGGATLQGLLFVPAGATGEAPVPGAVVAGAWTTVKEQMAGTYARELGARGVAALAFDFGGWGASDGAPRYVEDPARKTADVAAAARWLAARPEVDATRVGGLGICASAGYVAAVAADTGVARLALVAPWLHTPALAEGIYGGADAARDLIAKGRAAAPDDVLVAASVSDATAPMFNAPYYTEPDRGLIADYDNKFAVASWAPWLTYDAHASADALAVPTLVVASDAMALPAGARAYVARVGPGENNTASLVSQHWLDDASQFDFYDRADVVAQAAQLVADHFLTAAAAVPPATAAA